MDYAETIAYIDSLSPTLERPSLTRIEAFLSQYGCPQNCASVFHIGGTNGKGSTAAILDTVLRHAELKVGRYTGPHLLRWNERFHLNGTPIKDAQFADFSSRVQQMSHDFARHRVDLGELTWFEFLTAIAFLWFAENQIETAVLEVGLGGRFDATNAVSNVACSVVTNIDLDHTHILGETIEEIAFEKSGIFKAGVPALTAATGRALEVLRQRANAAGAPFYHCHLPDLLFETKYGDNSVEVTDPLWQSARAAFIQATGELSLSGNHQQLNALLAIAALYLAARHNNTWFSILADRLLSDGGQILESAFSQVYWPGRMQFIPALNLVLDGAHNPAGARALRQALEDVLPAQHYLFVISCFANKNAMEMLSSLVRAGDSVYISEASTRRATCSKEELAAIAASLGGRTAVFACIADAIEAAIDAQREPGEPIVVTGSFATVRESMTHFGWQTVEEARAGCVKIHTAAATKAATRGYQPR